MVLVAILLYFLPSIVVLARGAPSKAGVVMLNTFLGWTGIGWLVALGLAMRNKKPISYQTHSSTGVPWQVTPSGNAVPPAQVPADGPPTIHDGPPTLERPPPAQASSSSAEAGEAKGGPPAPGPWLAANDKWYPPEKHPSRSMWGREAGGPQERHRLYRTWASSLAPSDAMAAAGFSISSWPRGRLLASHAGRVVGEVGSQATVLGARVARKYLPFKIQFDIWEVDGGSGIAVALEDGFPSWALRHQPAIAESMQKTMEEFVTSAVASTRGGIGSSFQAPPPPPPPGA